MLPLTPGANALTTSRTADGKTLTPRTISMSSVRPMQRTRGPVRPQAQGLVRTWTWSRVRKRSSGAARCRRCVSTSSPVAPSASSTGAPGLRVDQLGVDEAARAEVHAVLLLALAPERDADVADPHRLGDPRAPALLELRAEGRLAAAGLAGDEHALDARAGEVDAALGRPLDEVGGVRGREHRGLGPSSSIASIRRSVFPVPTGMWQRPMRSNAASAAPATNGPGVVGRDDALARADARRRVAARRAGHPVVEVARGERDVARRAGRAARRVDADDLVARRAEVRADRVVGRARSPGARPSRSAAAARCRRARRRPRRRSNPAAASFSR